EPVSILFSEKFNDWYKWINLRRDVYANFGQSLANLLQEGDIRYLLTAKIAKKKEPSLSLRLYFSPKPWQSFVSIRSVSKFPPQWERAVPKNDGCVWVIPISDEDAERLRKKFS
ncbi:MAG: hypothetical protein LBV79_07520, partial [Candidatus Adiutrix sp.]|nr:hypothetical protein [Candidatus Adiutrix sp.]